MFKENDLVRPITEDGSGEIMRVLNDNDIVCHLSYVEGENKHAERLMDSKDLELVSDNQVIHEELKSMKAVLPSRTQEDLHDDISKMFVQVVQWLRANDFEERVRIRIEAENYSNSDLEVSFQVDLAYEETITSKNLFTSAKVALERSRENELLKPLSIPMFVEA